MQIQTKRFIKVREGENTRRWELPGKDKKAGWLAGWQGTEDKETETQVSEKISSCKKLSCYKKHN